MPTWIIQQGVKLPSPLARAGLCSQVTDAPRFHCPLATVTAWGPDLAGAAAIPVPLHHPGACETGAWEDAALPWHHEWSQEGCPDLLPTPGAWRLPAGPAGILETGITPEQWQNRLKARTVFPYCTLCSHCIFLVLSFLL